MIVQGSYVAGSKSSVLTIKTAKLATLSGTPVYKCKLKSAIYPSDSPDVINEMKLTLLNLGKTFITVHCFAFIIDEYLQ